MKLKFILRQMIYYDDDLRGYPRRIKYIRIKDDSESYKSFKKDILYIVGTNLSDKNILELLHPDFTMYELIKL